MSILGTPDFGKSQVDISSRSSRITRASPSMHSEAGGHWVSSGIERVQRVVGSDPSMHAALMGGLIDARRR